MRMYRMRRDAASIERGIHESEQLEALGDSVSITRYTTKVNLRILLF